MQVTIKHAVLLVELEDGNVHQAIIKPDMIRRFLESVATLEGRLSIEKSPLEGITLEALQNEQI